MVVGALVQGGVGTGVGWSCRGASRLRLRRSGSGRAMSPRTRAGPPGRGSPTGARPLGARRWRFGRTRWRRPSRCTRRPLPPAGPDTRSPPLPRQRRSRHPRCAHVIGQEPPPEEWHKRYPVFPHCCSPSPTPAPPASKPASTPSRPPAAWTAEVGSAEVCNSPPSSERVKEPNGCQGRRGGRHLPRDRHRFVTGSGPLGPNAGPAVSPPPMPAVSRSAGTGRGARCPSGRSRP